MNTTLSPDRVRFVRRLLIDLKGQWELQFEANGYTLEVDGVPEPVTPESVMETPYGEILRAIAEIDGQSDWTVLLPSTVRRRAFHEEEAVGSCLADSSIPGESE